jgi:hypothetical protein
MDPVLRPYHNEATVNCGPYIAEISLVYELYTESRMPLYIMVTNCHSLRSVFNRNFIRGKAVKRHPLTWLYTDRIWTRLVRPGYGVERSNSGIIPLTYTT